MNIREHIDKFKNFIPYINEDKKIINGGGKIVFSIEGKVGDNTIKKYYNIFNNRVFLHKKIKKIIDLSEIDGFTLNGPNKGLYKGSDGKIYSDISYSVEALGVDSNKLDELGHKILNEFPAESVLVYDYNTNTNFFLSK